MGIFNGFWEKDEFYYGKAPFVLQYIFNVGLGVSQFLNTLLGGDQDESISSRLARCQLDPNASKNAKKAAAFVDWVFGKNHCINALEFNCTRQKEIIHWSSTVDYPVPPAPKNKF